MQAQHRAAGAVGARGQGPWETLQENGRKAASQSAGLEAERPRLRQSRARAVDGFECGSDLPSGMRTSAAELKLRGKARRVPGSCSQAVKGEVVALRVRASCELGAVPQFSS